MYTHSLKQGIRDGFLAPYKAVKVHIDRDVEGYRPEKGQLDRDGHEVEDRIYNTRDFDRVLVLDERTRLVARSAADEDSDRSVLQPISGAVTPAPRSPESPGRFSQDSGRSR